jgi:hypothetical protein
LLPQAFLCLCFPLVIQINNEVGNCGIISIFDKKTNFMELIVKPRNEEELLFVQSVLNRMKIKNELREKDVKKRRKQEFLDSLEKRVETLNQAIRGEVELKNAFDLLDEL